GINGYTGTVTKQYQIKGKAISGYAVAYTNACVFNGEEQTPADENEYPDFKVYKKETKTTPEEILTQGDDYEVSYVKNVNAGTATMTIKGINAYTGTIKKTFKINQYDLNADAEGRMDFAAIGSVTHKKGGAKPAVVVTDCCKELVAGKDYTLSYSNNTKVNDGSNPKAVPTVKIVGKGNYKGTKTLNFTIAAGDLSNEEVVSVTCGDIVANASKSNLCKPAIKLYDSDGKVLVAGTDYEKNIVYTYVRNTEVQTITKVNNKNVTVDISMAEGELVSTQDIIPEGTEIMATITGKGNYFGTRSVVFRYIKADLSKASVTVNTQYFAGANVSVCPTKNDIKVKMGKTELAKTDYEIVGYKKNTAKGTAQVILRGVGAYGG
ncbi:MAG: hypothetical protein HUJ98_11775, partial [Bacteroidaceae bacterium]|nr:hypothetical protein [Bacteroidaceae bacterium]